MYNSEIHNRHSIRLKEFDYSQNGYYFVTICTKNRECFFGDVARGKIELSEIGKIVKKYWMEISQHFENVELDEYIVMPNHIHGIVIINDNYQNMNVGATLAVAQRHRNRSSRAGARPAPTIGDIVGSFKSICVVKWLQHMKENKLNGLGKFWQRNYYEHIIRNEIELNAIREYILNNPLQWEIDNENPKHYTTAICN